MQNTTPPYQKFAFFMEKLRLTPQTMAVLAPYRETLARGDEAYATFFYDYIHSMEETRRILDFMAGRGGLERHWRRFYRGFFLSGFNEEFLALLWSSGLRHVQMNVDQRYINLGYCMVRDYVHARLTEICRPEDLPEAVGVTNRMLDMCLMVATDSFMLNTVLCQSEVMDGMAHQLRNPLTIIGGFAKSLARNGDCAPESREKVEAVAAQATRMENLVDTATTYMDVQRTSVATRELSLQTALTRELDAALAKHSPEDRARLIVLTDCAETTMVCADEKLLSVILGNLLANALDVALADKTPRLEISARVDEENPRFVELKIFNTGPVPAAEEIQAFFAPFHSTKPLSAGLGLPMVKSAVQRLQGDVSLTPREDAGRRTGTEAVLRLARRCPKNAAPPLA